MDLTENRSALAIETVVRSSPLVAPRRHYKRQGAKLGGGAFPVLCLALAAIISGCASATIEEAAPQSALASAQPPPAEPIGVEEYPNLNIAPEPAAPQLSDAEKRATAESLRALRASAASGARPDSDVELLRRKARQHGQETLSAIEGE